MRGVPLLHLAPLVLELASVWLKETAQWFSASLHPVDGALSHEVFNRRYLAWTFHWPFQHSRILANGTHGKTSDSCGCQLSVSLHYCEVTSMIRNHAVWDTKTD